MVKHILYKIQIYNNHDDSLIVRLTYSLSNATNPEINCFYNITVLIGLGRTFIKRLG